MKWIIICFTLSAVGCCGNKVTRSAEGKADMMSSTVSSSDTLPACINEMIERFTNEAVQNPPRKIISYQYNGRTVFYVTPPCCDFFSELYDSNCKLLGHPDGGITGRGDGKLPDFNTAKSGEKIVWEDKRDQGSKK